MKGIKPSILLLFCVVIYLITTIFFIDKGYFWDNTQHTSIEAHYYYFSDFKSFFVPKTVPEWNINSTGSPVFLALITAFFWKYIAYKMWISHSIALFTLLFFVYNGYKLSVGLFGKKLQNWIFAIILMESSVITQYAIAGPDFVLITAFLIVIRAILEEKKSLIYWGAPFLFLISTRGTFTGAAVVASMLLVAFLHKASLKNQLRLASAFIPSILASIVYYTSYFSTQGWFFSNSKFANSHKSPDSFREIFHSILDLGLRMVENGRIFLWGVVIYLVFRYALKDIRKDTKVQFLIMCTLALTLIYLLFACITKMPFLTRYFMPHLLLAMLLFGLMAKKYLSEKIFTIIAGIILLFQITGHFWLYPEKMTKVWDSTLAHAPFYKLRNDCYNYLDSTGIDYNDVAAGFCLYDERRYYDLTDTKKSISQDISKRYYIYSNISGVSDDLIEDFKNPEHWTLVKEFQSWPVFIRILERK